MHHEGDIVDMDAAGRDVRGHEDLDGSGAEGRHISLAGILREIALEVDRRDSGLGQGAGELLGLVLRPDEKDRATFACSKLTYDLSLVRGLHGEEVMLHVGFSRGVAVDRMRDGVGEVAGDQGIDAPVEGCREEQSLPVARCAIEDPLDPGEEAEIGHVVGLVDDGDRHIVEADVSLLHEVLKPARARHDDVHPAIERGDLRALADASVDGGGRESQGARQRADRGLDLRRKFARGQQDEAPGPARLRGCTVRGEPHDQRQREGDRLAAAGSTAAEDVATGD